MFANVPRIITSWLPPRAVGVEIRRLDALRDDHFPAGYRQQSSRQERYGRRDAVPEHRQDARAANIGERRRSLRDSIEKRRRLDVRGLRVPGVDIALGTFNLSSERRLKHFAVSL